MQLATCTDQQRDAFFAARATMQTIEGLYDLHMFCNAPSWDVSELSHAARELAASEAWDLTGSRQDLEENLEQYAKALPLSVLIRSDWHVPGAEFEPAQFELLLATGGPAVRILGELDHRSQPYRPELQYQDWGIPWTDHPESKIDYLQWFADLFWYGE